MQITLIIFDFDGTLASSLDGIIACMGEALHGFGYARPSEDAVRSTIGLTLEDSIRKLTNHACPESDIPEVVRSYRKLHEAEAAPRTTLFDGAAGHAGRRPSCPYKDRIAEQQGKCWPKFNCSTIRDHQLLRSDIERRSRQTSQAFCRALHDAHRSGISARRSEEYPGGR